MAIRLSLLIVCLLLASCSSSPSGDSPDDPPKTGLTYLPLTVFAVDERQRYLSKYVLPENMRLVLSAIPGELSGGAGGQGTVSIPIKRDSMTMLDLLALREQMLGHLSPLINSEKNQDIRIEPAATEFLRLGTFAMKSNEPGQVGATGLTRKQGEERNWQMLVYFDRACQISGYEQQGEQLVEYDIQIPGEGFWLLNSYEDNPRQQFVNTDLAIDDTGNPRRLTILVNSLAESSI